MANKNKPLKTKYIGARVDIIFETTIAAYLEAADIGMGDLVRKSLKEFMSQHPIKETGELAQSVKALAGKED